MPAKRQRRGPQQPQRIVGRADGRYSFHFAIHVDMGIDADERCQAVEEAGFVSEIDGLAARNARRGYAQHVGIDDDETIGVRVRKRPQRARRASR